MGLMKKVNTAYTTKMWPSNPEERSAMNTIIACEDQHRIFKAEEAQRKRDKDSDDDKIADVYMQYVYVGNQPTIEGTYMVYDTHTASMLPVTIHQAANGHLIVLSIGEQNARFLDPYNMTNYRWFRLSTFLSDDRDFIESLPITLEA